MSGAVFSFPNLRNLEQFTNSALISYLRVCLGTFDKCRELLGYHPAFDLVGGISFGFQKFLEVGNRFTRPRFRNLESALD